MKHLKKIPFFCLLLLSCIFFTVCAVRGSKDMYRTYIEEEDLKTTPLLTAVFEGIHDGILPWDAFLPSEQDSQLAELPPSDIPQEIASADADHTAPSEQLTDSVDTITSAPSDDSSAQSEEHTPIPTVPATATPTPTPIPLGPDGLPIVEYMTVDASYFDDAVFIGDSRTRSLQLYSGLENTTFLADTGLTIYTVLDKELVPSTTSAKTTVREYLSTHHFQKIYLMLGINELGTGTAETFVSSYSEVLQTIRELQPDAVIYLQAILNISESKHAEGTYINNNTINERNQLLKTLADNQNVYWLDANPAICDENGFLIDEYTFDGVHLQAKYVPIWVEWLEQHAVQNEAVTAIDSPAEQ